MQRGLVGSEMCIRDRVSTQSTWDIGVHFVWGVESGTNFGAEGDLRIAFAQGGNDTAHGVGIFKHGATAAVLNDAFTGTGEIQVNSGDVELQDIRDGVSDFAMIGAEELNDDGHVVSEEGFEEFIYGFMSGHGNGDADKGGHPSGNEFKFGDGGAEQMMHNAFHGSGQD
eukprot:TRINITY_DN8310_c0_g2_i3.p2 TRINITY_DN8310_c0_g2~~TRINITY_DN8310_c0_g2_i3.p2  ORF type:complete len:169 (+),score=52.28 TRINITY_DN8310_c0_g2_i3:112-618(+)